MRKFKFVGLAMAMMTLSATATAEPVMSVKSSGMLFKDTITVEAIDDPTIDGVTCYVTYVEIDDPNFSDPTDSSIACRQTGVIKGKLISKNNVFEKSKNAFFKTQKVSRVFDQKRRSLVYLTYTTKMTGKNASHSVSVVTIPQIFQIVDGEVGKVRK